MAKDKKQKFPHLRELEQRSFADKEHYEAELAAAQKRLLAVQQAYLLQGRRAVIVFEGTDAAGKGGTIQRLTEGLDPRFCKVWPIGAPDEHERKVHWLARFVTRLPETGTIAVFDRSWYGRVLVERVEGLIQKAVWKRAYTEIVEFERMLLTDGTRLVKIYLHIDKDEQARRFAERLTDPYKRWKITKRDFEARGFFDEYQSAAEDLFERTSTKDAPWTLLSSQHKWYARVQALNLIADVLGKDVDLGPPLLDPELQRLAKKMLGVEVKADPKKST